MSYSELPMSGLGMIPAGKPIEFMNFSVSGLNFGMYLIHMIYVQKTHLPFRNYPTSGEVINTNFYINIFIDKYRE